MLFMLNQEHEHQSAGLERFEQQRQQLSRMLNNLQMAMQSGKGRAVAKKIAADLPQFMRDHFEQEDRIARLCHVRNHEKRRSVREYLQEKANNLLNNCDFNDPASVIDLLYFLDFWLESTVEPTTDINVM